MICNITNILQEKPRGAKQTLRDLKKKKKQRFADIKHQLNATFTPVYQNTPIKTNLEESKMRIFFKATTRANFFYFQNHQRWRKNQLETVSAAETKWWIR